MGEVVEFTAKLPENPQPLVLRGKVVSGSPLLASKSGRSLDLETESADPEMKRLLGLGGAADAPLALDRIER
jgi:hypothetical protein